MKLHLPVSLFKSILVVMGVACSVTEASIMHRDASIITYTDFGQNTGRYVVGNRVNRLLDYIRTSEGGVTISYTGGQATYTMPHGMIDFGSTYCEATNAAISPTAVATVAHNYTCNDNFTGHVYGIGEQHAIKYKAIEYSSSSVFVHNLKNDKGVTDANLQDHRVTRLSKVITDAPYAEIYDVASKGLSNLTYYHTGFGEQREANYATSHGNLSTTPLSGSYQYATGGVTSGWVWKSGSGTNKVILATVSFAAGGISDSNPLPWMSTGGDSGSPIYVWDTQTQTYQYIASCRGELTSGYLGSAIVMDTDYDKQTVDSFTKKVDMSSAGTVYLNGVTHGGETRTDGTYTTTIWSGTVSSDAAGTNTLTSFNGLQSGLNTWGNLSALKDVQTWYSYDQSYVQPGVEDLFYTENLQFNAEAAANTIVLNDTVDLGVGYAEFNGGSFTITSAEGENNQFNHAGYVINDGAEVHLQLTGSADYMYEWRKIGAGDLYIEGSGNNDVLLNIGGSGKTYLNRTGGEGINSHYAAYNVLVNNGATVVIKDTEQIARDLTFGNRGGTLDMNGNSMEWRTTAETEDSPRAGFSINALTEDALIANYSSNSTLTYTEGGHTTFKGSFADSANSSLKVIYNGGAESSWTLHSIHTNLQHADSGLQVDSGRVILSGTNTIHGTGSATGRNNSRYFHEDDWHYADATMNVSVQNGGTFELGSHALLTGNVTVENGGTFVMRETVRHQMEYVEGGQSLEDTGKYSDYMGHKGEVVLKGGTFAVEFNSGVDADVVYNRNVTGSGALTVDTGTDGGCLVFGSAVDAGVSKTLNRGELRLTDAAADDITNKWLVNAGGVMVQYGNLADTLNVIDTASTGTLGLTGDITTQVDLSSHSGMGIGALAGTTVQYGAADTQETLNTAATLGGGGKLLVNYVLSGSDTLNVDGKGWSSGEVQLNQVAADYSGTVNVQSEGGRMTLTTEEEGVFANATVNIKNGGVWQLNDTQSSAAAKTLNVNAGGTLKGKNVVFSGEETTLELCGSLDYGRFIVQDGATLNLRAGGRLDADNAATISGTGIMSLNAQTLVDKVNLENGGTMYGSGGTIGSNATVLATAGTGNLNADGGTFNVNGTIGAVEGAVLSLENGTFNLYADGINAAGGELKLNCTKVNIQSTGSNTQNFGGTITVASDVEVHANRGNGNNALNTHNVNHLHIANGCSLTISENSNSWAHAWNISSLTGEGTIYWKSEPYWWATGTSRMILSSANDFSGTIYVQNKYFGGFGGYNDYSMQHLSLAHDFAAQNMHIVLDAQNNTRPALAVSTRNAHIFGLSGDNQSDLYAGAVKTAGQGNATSSALNTLTVTGDGTYTFEGNVIGDASNGLNLVMDGTGTQTFTGTDNVVHDVIAKQGSLVFTNAPTIHGDIGVAQGAMLQLGTGAFTLAEGTTLQVLAGTPGAVATLNNGLILSGGTIDFGAYNEGVAALVLGENCTMSIGSPAAINLAFSNRGNIKSTNSFPEAKYLLMGGDWSTLKDNIKVQDCVYLDVTLDPSSTGLYATFTLRDGYEYWMSDDPGVWTPSEDNVVITGMEGYSAEINLQADTSIKNGILDNDTTVVIKSETGNKLHFDAVEKVTDGDLQIDAGVSAGAFTVSADTHISGEGKLEVTELGINADLTTSMALDVERISLAENSSWTLEGTRNAFTQELSVAQLNSMGRIGVEGEANLSFAPATESTLSATISGTGMVSKAGAGNLISTGTIQVGEFNVNAGGYQANGAVNIGTLNVAKGLTVTMWNAAANSGASKVLGTVALGDGANFVSYDAAANASKAVQIGTLEQQGTTATLRDQHFSGYYEIGTLNSTVNNATLNIVKISDSTAGTVVKLGNESSPAGNFKGNIVLKSATGESGDARRSLFLVLGGTQAAAGAVVNLASSDSSNAVLGLGINADNVTIAGLASASGLAARAKVFSGTVNAGIDWDSAAAAPDTVGDAFRTLTINTAGNHTFHGSVLSHLNLVKQGSGTQIFAGAPSGFNGSIDVQEGTLGLHYNMFQSASQLKTAAGTVLSLTGFEAANQTPYDLSLKDNMSVGGVLELNFTPDGNGSTFDFSKSAEVIRVASGLVKMNGSIFRENGGPSLVMTSTQSQLCFDGTDTVVTCHLDLDLDGAITVHANSEKSGILAGEIRGRGGLIKAGAGTLTLSGFNVYEGSTTVNAGTLVVSNLSDLGAAPNVVIKNAGTLVISTVQEATDGVVTLNGVSGGGVLAIDLTDDATQKLAVDERFTGTTYIKSGQFAASGSKFGNGLRLGNGVNLNLTETEAFTFAKNLTLDGTSKLHRATDAALTISGNIGTGSGCSSHLMRCDSGVLNLNGRVNLSQFTQDADDITNINGTATIGRLNAGGGAVYIGHSGTLNLDSALEVGNENLNHITGSGTLGIKLAGTSYNHVLQVNSAYTGTTYVQQGNFTINDSTFGNTLKLKGGVNFQLNGGSTVVLDKNLVLEGTSQVHQNTSNNIGATLTINGTVTGAGTYERKGGGTLTFNNTVNLGGFKQEVDAATIFNGLATVNSFNVTNGSVTIGENATLNLNGTYSGDATIDKVFGSGTLGIKLAGTSYDHVLQVNSAYTGTTYVQQGNFTINDSTFGNTLKLKGGVNFQLNGGSTVVLDKNLVLEGTSQVHQNTSNNIGATLTINGTVTGAGTYERRGGGILSFHNIVNLGGFTQINDASTTDFYGEASIGTLNVTTGTVNVKQGATLEVDNLTGDATKVSLAEGASLILNQNVSDAEGAYSRRGAGSVTFGGAVNLLSYTQDVAGAVTTFDGADSTIGTLSVLQGAANVNGTLSLSSLELGQGKTLHIGGTGKVNLTENKSGAVLLNGFTGTGTLGIKLTTDYNNKVSVNSDFTGGVEISAGYLTLDGSSVNKITLTANNVEAQLMTGTTAKSWDGDIELLGSHKMHSNSSTDFTFTGHVSGVGTYAKQSTGTLRFAESGSVELGAYSQTGGDTYFNGRTEIAGKLEAKGGSLYFSGASDKRVGELDAGSSTVNLGSGVNLQVEGNMWLNTMNLAENASFSKDAMKVIATGNDATITKKGTTQFDYTQQYHQISNAEVQMSSETVVTLASQLTNSVLKNLGTGALNLTYNANSLTGLVAAKGDVSLQNLAAAASLNLLEVAGGMTVGAYTGADASSAKAAVTVSDSATFGAGAVLNTACLTLADGATLEMTGLDDGAVTLNGALTFGSGLKLGESLLASVEALDYGEILNLFIGVSEVTLPAVVAEESSRVLASSVFSNVQSDTLYVDYQVIDNVGTLMVVHVPEPATATLGLLALTALAARRRRKA